MKNKKPIIFISLITVVLLAIGVTLAYYTTTDTFNNEFNTGNYSIQTQEAFVSPDNWTPGTTTLKTVIATNKGNTPAAVRIKLTPSWEDKNGDPLPLTDGTNEAAIINFASNLNSKWIYDNGYYYFKNGLGENESTTSLINSVTFNPAVTFDKTRDCDTVNGVTTCTTTFNDYAGGKYTLQIEVETAQFDKYKEIWGTTVELKEPGVYEMIMIHDAVSSKTFGKNISRDSFESIITVNNINVPVNAIDSWDVSAEQNETVMAWYLDSDNDSKYELYLGQDGGVTANIDSKQVFSYFQNVEVIDLTYFDTSHAENMSLMFGYAGFNRPTFNIIGLSEFDTSMVTDMNSMFVNTGMSATTCSIGDISEWDVSKVTNMVNMFVNTCYNATTFNIGDLGDWDVSNVEYMAQTFYYTGYSATTWSIGDLSEWNTSNVTVMNAMFAYSGFGATTWNVGNLDDWNVGNVTNMNAMFASAGYSATTWNVGNLNDWNVGKVTDMTSMFSYAGKSAQTFDIGNLSNWNTSNVTNMSGMFYQAGYNATTWNSIGTLKVYETDIWGIFESCKNAKATLNIYSNPTSYSRAFNGAATITGSGITVNYSSTTTNIDNIIATKSSNSNVVKGSVLS